MTDISQFLNDINQKDDLAWKELYRYFYASLCCYSSKVTGDSGSAEDVVQNCFIELYDSSFSFPNIKAITAYMYRSVYHRSLNIIRNKKSSAQIHREWFDGLRESEEEADGRAFEEEVIGRFYQVLYELPTQQREILMGSLRGEKIKDTAERLSLSENTVKTQKKRAYLYLRKNMGDAFSLVMLLIFS